MVGGATEHTTHWLRSGRGSVRALIENSHGAAFLLAVYLASLTLIALGGISLQRTITEVRASQISRDTHQAFWASEAGMDQALASLRQQDESAAEKARKAELDDMGGEYASALAQFDSLFADDSAAQGPFATPSGSYSFQITSKIEVLNPETMRITKTITSTGTVSGVQNSVTGAVSTEDMPLSGIFANGPIVIGDTLVKGSLHSGSGTPGSVFINDATGKARVFGDVTIAPPDPENPYTELVGPARQYGAAASLMDPAYTVGIGIRSLAYSGGFMAHETVREVITGNVAAVEMPKIQPIQLPTGLRPADSRKLQLEPDETLIIEDGDPVWDMSGLPNTQDGKIVLNLEYLHMMNNSQLVLEAPDAEIYVTGASPINDPSYWWAPYSGADTAIYLVYNNVLVAVDPSTHKTNMDGLKLLVTESPQPDKGAGPVSMYNPKAFFGSIWAPESYVTVGPSDEWVDENKQLQFGFEDFSYDELREEALENPDVPGGLEGMVSKYIVADTMRPTSMGCSAALVDEVLTRSPSLTTAATESEPITLQSWMSTQERVTPEAN